MTPARFDRRDAAAVAADLKRRYPLAEVVARYGIDLRPGGAGRLLGRCPFHDDHQPSLTLYLHDPADEHFHCFAGHCAAHGDVIHFVRRLERQSFWEAVATLTGVNGPARLAPRGSPYRPTRPARPLQAGIRDPAGRACLAVAASLYHRHLLGDHRALAYCAGRGLDHDALVRHRVGYVPGDGLVTALAERGLPLDAARWAGLLDRRGRERLAGRIVIPELRADGPLWLIGRRLGDGGDGPKYLSLTGSTPLLGWLEARERREVYLTEGPFDRLTLSGWGLPALALCGTRVRPDVYRVLDRFARVFLALDNDEAGRAATAAFREALGERAVPIPLPDVEDVADLALRPNGRTAFLQAVTRVAGEAPAYAA